MTVVSTADGRPIGASAAAIAPGLLLATGIALTAGVLSGLVPSSIPPVTIAIALGIVVGQWAAARTEALGPGLAFTSQRVLRLGIVLLGARLSFEQIARIGIPATVVVVITMAAALSLVLVLARLASVEPRLAILLAVGAAVCGNSAVAATAPVIAARSRDVAFAVATVTLFGTAAVFVYPLIGHAIPLADPAFGLWTGIAVNDTSQVVAASAAYSPQALDVATVVKLIRNALMAPLLVGIAWAWARTGGVVGDTSAGVRKAVPVFVLGFVAMTVLRSVGIIGPDLADVLGSLSGWCILIGLAGVGLSIRVSDLRAVGPQAFAVGLGAAIAIGLATLIAITSLDLASSLPA